tara:strand:- start:125 stop:754 length:630 start_codon:yes stop_codon:yes gene_type:complete
MSTLIIDTETNGIRLYKQFWSQGIMSIGMVERSENGKIVCQDKFYIKGVKEVKHFEGCHSLTVEECNESGISLENAIRHLLKIMRRVDTIVAHNIEFDIGVLKYNIKESGQIDLLQKFNKILDSKNLLCTMKLTVDICKIPSHMGFKYPKLIELYEFLYHEKPDEELHDALGDCHVLKKCLDGLLDQGYIMNPISDLSNISYQELKSKR